MDGPYERAEKEIQLFKRMYVEENMKAKSLPWLSGVA